MKCKIHYIVGGKRDLTFLQKWLKQLLSEVKFQFNNDCPEISARRVKLEKTTVIQPMNGTSIQKILLRKKEGSCKIFEAHKRLNRVVVDKKIFIIFKNSPK